MLVSRYMDEDVESGYIVKVLGLTRRDGVTWAKCLTCDGIMYYADQDTALNLGIIGSEEI